MQSMRGFFQNYHQYLNERFVAGRGGKKPRQLDAQFYDPRAYVLLSNFDLAFISLIEGYEFPVQRFRPFDPLWPRGRNTRRTDDRPTSEFRSFPHRTIVGPGPVWGKRTDIVKKANETFLLPRPKRPPLIGICQIKLNNSLLLGAGGTFLRCMSKAILSRWHARFRSSESKEYRYTRPGQTRIIILESYAWHEFTLLIFSDSFNKIRDLVKIIQGMTLLDVGYYLARWARRGNKPDREKSHLREWRAMILSGDLYGLGRDSNSRKPILLRERRIKTAHLSELRDFRELSKLGPTGYLESAIRAELLQYPPFGTHVIFNTTTTMGFDAELMEDALKTAALTGRLAEEEIRNLLEKSKIDDSSKKRDQLVLFRNWAAKAGHQAAALQMGDDGGDPGIDFVDVAGRFDYTQHCDWNERSGLAFKGMTSRQVVHTMLTDFVAAHLHRDSIEARRLADRNWRERDIVTGSGGELSEKVAGRRSVQSALGFMPGPRMLRHIGEVPHLPGHVTANSFRKRFCLESGIAEIDGLLKQLMVPRVVSDRVLNAIALYNDGIRDNFLFGSFLELGPYVHRIQRCLEQALKPDHICEPAGLALQLSSMVDNFELGWRNRHHGGWRLGEVSDTNLEFKGGVQQLVSAFHIAFQNLSWLFTGDHETLAVVAGAPGISVGDGCVRLSLADVFTPEFFAARVAHEAAEQLVDMLCCEPDYGNGMFSDGHLREALRGLSRQTVAIPAERVVGSLGLADLRESGFFNEVYADFCEFRLVFLSERRLYVFWNLALFAAADVAWCPPKRGKFLLRNEQLDDCLLRMFMVLGMFPCGTPESDAALVLQYFEELDPHVRFGIGPRIQRSAEHVRRLLQIPDVRSWVEQVGTLAREFQRRTDLADKQTLLRQIDDAKRCLARGQSYGGEWRTARLMKTWPLKSKSYADGRRLDTCDTIKLLHAYLKLVAERCGYEDKDKNLKFLLVRDERMKPLHRLLEPEHYAPLVFDPREGNFARDADFRREYFMWRSALVRSFCDMAERAKLLQCMAHTASRG